MVKIIAATSFVLTALILFEPKEAKPMDLDQFRWKNRLLFLFAPDGRNPVFKKIQSEINTQKTEVEDRNLIVFEVLEDGPSRVNQTQLDPQAADSIRNRFRAPHDKFSLILVGKDGGTKMKRHDQADLEEVFELIDSMPMRKNEMRQKRKD